MIMVLIVFLNLKYYERLKFKFTLVVRLLLSKLFLFMYLKHHYFCMYPSFICVTQTNTLGDKQLLFMVMKTEFIIYSEFHI